MLFSRRFCLSLATNGGFAQFGLSETLTGKLREKNITHPTEIQSKALPRALSGRHVVLNAETGSGKTLCFLLPIIHRQLVNTSVESVERTDTEQLNSASVQSPLGLVLVPTPDLAHQISLVYKDLSPLECSVLYGKRPLLLSKSVGLVVATPTSLVQYDLVKVLKNVGVVCCDEADTLLAGGERKATWRTLEMVKKLHQKQVRDNAASSPQLLGERKTAVTSNRQMIFTAATLPTNTPKSIGRVLSQWLPKNTQFISTERSHHIVPSADVMFHNVSLSPPEESRVESGMELFDAKLKLLVDLILSDQGQKTLVFCNTVLSCQALNDTLSSGVCGHLKVLSMNKSIPPEERVQLISDFNEGLTDILLCTDLASRGIDMVGVDRVIMFDFPVNSADFLHRAGRTARAGRNGKVIAFVGPSDQCLADEIKRLLDQSSGTAVGEGNGSSFNSVFSRNKMFRRRMRRRELREETVANV